jgi:elongation factor P
MLSYPELKKGVKIILDSEPYEIIEASHLFKGRGHSVLQAKLKNLNTGNLISKTFHPSDIFEEAEISKIEAKFLYQHRDKFFFSEAKNPAERFDLTLEQIGEQGKFLKPNQTVEGIIFENRVINVSLPIKINLKVTEAPPGIKGGRAEPGTKTVALETGAKINAPLFIKEGDIIEINTQTGQYVRRIE